MSYARLHTACISVATVIPILVEVDVQPGLPVFSIIGLPDKGLEEARQRVRSAIRNSGYAFPLGRVTDNLSPSHLRKQGSSYDLPIALGILTATHVISELRQDLWVLGELGLEGEVRDVARLPFWLQPLGKVWNVLFRRKLNEMRYQKRKWSG